MQLDQCLAQHGSGVKLLVDEVAAGFEQARQRRGVLAHAVEQGKLLVERQAGTLLFSGLVDQPAQDLDLAVETLKGWMVRVGSFSSIKNRMNVL